jgi:hypothetical protein
MYVKHLKICYDLCILNLLTISEGSLFSYIFRLSILYTVDRLRYTTPFCQRVMKEQIQLYSEGKEGCVIEFVEITQDSYSV